MTRKNENTTGLDNFFVGIVCVAALVFFGALGAYVWRFAPGSGGVSVVAGDWAEFGEYLGGTLGAFFGFLAFIGVVINIVLQRRALDDVRDRAAQDDRENRDRLFLKEYRKGYDTAFSILTSSLGNQPDMRIKWVAAARVIEVARRLSQRIESSAYQEMVLLDLPIQSERFNKFLECPATFYYGIDINELNNIPAAEHIELAAKLSTKRRDGSPCLRTIPEEAIFSVWNAIQYPQAYTDVLGQKYNDNQRTFLPPGLREFIDHTRQWHSVAGNLVAHDSTNAVRGPTDAGSQHPRV
jgi:hypothetical protein